MGQAVIYRGIKMAVFSVTYSLNDPYNHPVVFLLFKLIIGRYLFRTGIVLKLS